MRSRLKNNLGVILTVFMTVFVLACIFIAVYIINDHFYSKTEEGAVVEAAAATHLGGIKNTATGIFSEVPNDDTKELGSAENPFMVLEIVPSEDMAQFGYLVGGEEPAKLSTEYGYFERVAAGAGDYAFSDKEVKFLNVPEGTGHYSYSLVTEANYSGIVPAVPAGFENSDGANKWVEVNPGSGLYSSTVYKYKGYGGTNAQYSLKYMKKQYGELEYIGGLRGPAEIEDSVEMDNVYETDLDLPDNMSYYAQIKTPIKDYFIKFKYIGNEPTTENRYSVKEAYNYINIDAFGIWSTNESEAYLNYKIVGENPLGPNDTNYSGGHFEFEEKSAKAATYHKQPWNQIIGDVPQFSKNYAVTFEYDPEGDYIIDSLEYIDSYHIKENSIHALSTYTLSDTGKFISPWGPATMTDGLYQGGYTNIKRAGYTLPQLVGTYTDPETGTVVYLGEYEKTVFVPDDYVGTVDYSRLSVVREGNTLSDGTISNRKDIGLSNWDRYILVEDPVGDMELMYCYTMEAHAGGDYIWHGSKAPDGHTITVAEAGLDAITLRSNRILDLSDPKYDRFAATATLGIWNDGSGNNTELFKKYGIGLAYVDNDYTKGKMSVATATDRRKLQNKLDAYNVRVITVTPNDLVNLSAADTANNKAETNLRNLVERADMIVINETVDPNIRYVWGITNPDGSPARNTDNFPSQNTTGKDSFTQIDLSAEATLRIFAKLAGHKKADAGAGRNNQVYEVCPVIYDYNIYKNITSLPVTDAKVSEVTMNSSFSDSNVFIENDIGYDYNLYKIYMFSQQMNPMTLYNAYISDESVVYDNRVINVVGSDADAVLEYSGSETMNAAARRYWSKYTIIPYSAMTLTEWALGQEGAFARLGITLDPKLGNKENKVKNRLYSYNYEASDGSMANVIEGFSSPIFPSYNEYEINYFMHGDNMNAAPVYYNTRDIVYYLLHNAIESKNYEKHVTILEIEPFNSFKSASYWFWYISRYVSNFTGGYTVNKMNSSEFIGNVDDLNSEYDVVYIGAEIEKNSEIKNFLPKDETGIVEANGDVLIPVTQVIPFEFSKAMVIESSAKYIVISEEHYNSLSLAERSDYTVVEPAPLSLRLLDDGQKDGPYARLSRVDLGEYGVMLGLDASVTGDGDDYFVEMSGNPNVWESRWRGLSIKVTFNPIMVDVPNSDFGGADGLDSVRWVSTDEQHGNLVRSYPEGGNRVYEYGYFELKRFYVKSVLAVTSSAGVQFQANTKVQAGERITNDSGVAQTYLKTNYCYTHTGRRINSWNGRGQTYDRDIRRGLLAENPNEDSINDFVFSGNDITALKMDDLFDFANAGYPFIISSDLLDANGNISREMVDPSSYMYELLTTLLNTEGHEGLAFVDNDTTNDAKFVRALNNKNFSLELIEWPTDYKEYQDTAAYKQLIEKYADFDKETATVEEAERYNRDWNNFYSKYYVNGQNINNKKLEFRINIKTNDPGRYELRLYIDFNANGRYDETDERLDSLEIESFGNGAHIPYDRLEPNTNYKIVRDMSEFVGAVPWKLEVFDVTNKSVRDQKLGICAMRVDKKKRLNILEIVPDGKQGGNQISSDPLIYFPTDEEILRANELSAGPITVANMETYFNNSLRSVNENDHFTGGFLSLGGDWRTDLLIRNAGLFYYYMHSLNEFDVHFFRLSVSELTEYASMSDPDNCIYGSADVYITQTGMEEPVKLDMMVIGFTDMMQDIGDNNARELISGYTEAGNTMLFTHDTTSLSVTPLDWAWGSKLTHDLRKDFGMDRYDVLENHGLLSAFNNLSKAPDAPWLLGSSTRDSYYISTNTEGGNLVTHALAQGLTNYNIAIELTDNPREDSVKATRSNKGQIIEYPYTMGDEIPIAPTHGQYYQLDMEDDEVVVWYCLSGNSDYYSTRNDVRNNYYIYNKGNVIYSGIGHSGNISVEEVKLFVNTMAYSYSIGGSDTTIAVTNADSNSLSYGPEGNVINEVFIYVDYDATSEIQDAVAIGSDIMTSFATEMIGGSPVDVMMQDFNLKFTLINYSAAINKQFLLQVYPVVYEGGVRRVLEDSPLDLDTYYDYFDTRPLAEPAKISYKPRGSDFKRDYYGKILALGNSCYMEVPLYAEYYESKYPTKLERYGLQLKTLGNPAFMSKVGNRFEFEIRVDMFYGTYTLDEDGVRVYKNEPIKGVTRVAFMRRGSFLLD